MKKQVLKTLLTKQIIDETFYGVLGVLPDASQDEILHSFKAKIKENLSIDDLKKVLKAYGILSSDYRNIYDKYIENVLKGIDVLINEDINTELVQTIIDNVKKENSTLPEGIFMQPWATSI